MGQKINVLIISLIAVAISVVSFVFAINYRKESISYFHDSGYIISNSYEEGLDNVNKLYFETETSYKQTEKDTYAFTNSEGERVNVSEESFVHYSNGSIMSLKKGVAIDLSDIDSKLISYYNIFEGSVLTKKNEVYEIENLNDTITFSKLMFKISNNKYLIGSPKLVISFSDDQTVDMEGYAEIEYVNENVIRIYNDKVNYQTIASDLYLMIDDIKIDLEYKTIRKNNVEYLTMADMVINSDDNIEVLPEKEEIIVPEDSNNNSENNNNNNNNNQGNNNGSNAGGEIDTDLQEGLDNLITNLPEGGEQVEEKEEIIQPRFKVDSMDVTTLGFENLSLSFEDESSILYGNRVVEILENSTGKVVATLGEWEEGMLNYTVNSYFSLKPNTAYTLNVIGQYKIEDTIYDRTFISKIFRTLDIGLDIVDDYKTDDSLSFTVYKNSYSEVNGFTYNIMDKTGNVIVEDTGVEFNGTPKLIITETEKFLSNTEYILTIKDIQYGNDIFTTVSYQELQLIHETKTLKVNPFKVSDVILKGLVDSSKNTVAFTVEGINDINGGIVSYTYNIYNNVVSNEEIVDFNNEAIKTVTKNDSTPLTLAFEDLGTAVGDVSNVYFNVSINFDDNEKTIVYTSSNSQPITLSGTPYPTVVDYVKSEENKNSEVLAGEILIDDAYNFMKINNISYYKIDIKEKVNSTLGGTEQLVGTVQIETPNAGTSRYALPVYFEGLIPNSEYILYVYLLHNGKYIYLGYDIASTAVPEPVYLNVDYPVDSIDENNMFDFEISRNLDKESVSFNSLKYLNFQLYRSSASNNSGDVKWEKIDFDATIPENQDSQDLNNLIYNNEIISVTSSDFEFYTNNYENIYNYKIVVTGFAQGYEIPVKVNDSDTNEFLVEFNNIAPHLSIVAKQMVQNSESGKLDNTLADDTIVGVNFEIQTTENPMNQIVNEISYSIFEAETYDSTTNTCTPKNSEEQSNAIVTTDNLTLNTKTEKKFVPFVSSNVTGLHRGVHYCMVYSGTYEVEGQKIPVSSKTLHFMAEKQHPEITGYIKSYDGDDLVFNLDIEDPDNALVKSLTNTLVPNIKLYKTSPEEEILVNSVSDNGDYTFKGLSSKNYVLNIVENVGNGEVTRTIYETKLDDIIMTNSINVVVDTRSPGKIILKIPYGTCDTEFESNCKTNNLDETMLSRISGLGILKNETTYAFDLQRADGYLYTEINLSDIETYGTITNGNMLTLNKISVLYDSGKIVDYNDGKSFFIKLKNQELDTNYFNKDTDELNKISKNSIFNKNDLSYDSYYKHYNISGTNSTLKFNVFNSAIENSSIGILLNKTDSVSRLIHFNEVTTSGSILYNTNYEPTSTFIVTDVLSTDKITTTYTSTGANVSFDIINSAIINGTELIVELSDKTFASVTCTRAGENCNWSNYSSNDSKSKIKKISVDSSNKVTISFDDINGAEYKYSIKFKTPDSGSSEFTYNNESKKNNQDIVITALKELYLNDYSAVLNKIYWNWTTADKNDLKFIKQIEYSFVVDTNKYKLETNEKIVYKILAKNKSDDSKSKYIVGDLDNSVDLLGTNTGEFNLYEKTLDAGTYEIILQPELEISSGNSKETVDLQDFVLKNELIVSTEAPTFNVIKSADPIFRFTMLDEDGMLTTCPAPATGDIMGYVNTDTKNYYEDTNNLNKKVVYFELYSMENGEIKDLKGYSPIPFITKSGVLDLTNYFKNKNLPTGSYTVKVSHCLNGIEGTQSVTFDPFYIYNISSLNMQLITMADSYILLLANPDETTKDSIRRIKYQYTTSNGSVVKELNNLDNDINNTNNIVYTTSIIAEDVTNYFLGLPVDGTLTSKITNLRIDFYSGPTDDTLITTYSK